MRKKPKPGGESGTWGALLQVNLTLGGGTLRGMERGSNTPEKSGLGHNHKNSTGGKIRESTPEGGKNQGGAQGLGQKR